MTYNVNDIVSLDPELSSGKYRGQNFKVVKVNPKTLRLQSLQTGANVVADRFLIQPAVGVPAGATAESVPLVEHLVCGSLVRIGGLRQEKGWMTNGAIGVVLVDKGDKINVAPLGGFEDRYAKLPRRCVTALKPTPAELAVLRDQLS